MDPVRRLLEIMTRLRDPHSGCPWDQRQTYRTIVPYTLEEAYEVADAIERGDMHELRDELGDLLFQVVFYSQIAREEGLFEFDDVAQGICEKMVRRHPHVFADVSFDDDEALREAWEQHKAEERAARMPVSDPSALDGITRALPALIRADKLQKRAARVGFDWPDARGPLAKTREEFDEVEAEWSTGDRARLEDELGDLLFALVNVVRLSGLDAEQALRRANDKFERRFRWMERHADGPLDGRPLDALESLWEAAKAAERDVPQ
jgi:ATP diphosphatase